MREIALIIFCLVTAILNFKFAFEEKKTGDTGGTILLSSIGILSVVCIIINIYIMFTK